MERGLEGNRRRATLGSVALAGTSMTAMALLLGCEGPPIAGPCEHNYLDAVIHVDSVVDATTGAAVDSFRILAAKMNGTAYPPNLDTIGHAQGVQVEGDTLLCKVPCFFGTSEGIREYLLDAVGYPAQWDTVDAHYGVFEGGCPSYNDEGVHIQIRLHK